MAHPNHPNDFLSVLIGPDGEILDRKLWQREGDAIGYVTGRGLDPHPTVAKAEIYAPNGELVWIRSDSKAGRATPPRADNQKARETRRAELDDDRGLGQLLRKLGM
jgi:hypothetical protein